MRGNSSDGAWDVCEEVRAFSGGWAVQWTRDRHLGETWVPGRVRLLRQGAVVCEFKGIERPCAAEVSKSGDVVVVDWTADTPGRPQYRSRVIFFGASGEAHAVYHFRANPGDLTADDDRVYLTLCGTPAGDEVERTRFTWSGARVLANVWPDADLDWPK